MSPNRALKPLAVLLAIIAALGLARPAEAQEQRCFDQTGHCISGRFLEFWQQNGGLAVFGYPIASAREERNRDTGKLFLTQWFERNRFELHPENRRPYDVLLGRLGEDTLLKSNRDWRAEYEPATPSDDGCESASTDGRVFVLCPPLRAYYRAHGLEFDGQPGVSEAESLALFGLPLTQPATETNASGDTVVTQWFERARLEYHPANPEPYSVLLGLLGNELRGVDRPDMRVLPVTIVDRDGVVYETRGATAVRLGTTPDGGAVLDAVRDGRRIVLLRERGLQSFADGRGRELAAFERGAARFGQLARAGEGQVLYTYASDANSPTGFNGVAGIVQANAARSVRTVPNTMTVLGLDRDARAMYLIDRGQDPSFVAIKVVALADGRELATLPFSGDGAAALSPDRATIAATATRQTYADTLVFYELDGQTGAPRNVQLPREGWSIQQLQWSADGREIYVLAYPNISLPTGELWRFDRGSGRSELVAGDLPTDTRLLAVDGRTLLVQTEAGALLIDLASGAVELRGLPEGSVIVR